ncbi:hypothetical protein LXL04_008888 [Taraxacum kok-saghyz]
MKYLDSQKRKCHIPFSGRDFKISHAYSFSSPTIPSSIFLPLLRFQGFPVYNRTCLVYSGSSHSQRRGNVTRITPSCSNHSWSLLAIDGNNILSVCSSLVDVPQIVYGSLTKDASWQWRNVSTPISESKEKAIDCFRSNDHGILIATDVAARGLDIPGVRTVVHYQLTHSAEVYVHRSERTARASADGCSIAVIPPKESSKKVSNLGLNIEKPALTLHPQNDKVLMLAQETKMALCETCGSFLIANDALERTQSHVTGKQHIGYGLVRDFGRQ